MTNKEKINRNIGLSFDFLKTLIEEPRMLVRIENDSILEFIEKDFAINEKVASRKKNKLYKIKQTFVELGS